MPPPTMRRRAALLLAIAAVIAAGLAVRFLPLGLPAAVVKYAGSVLWGAMVYGVVALIRPGASLTRLAFAALAVAILVELFRLVHTPWLDAFRLTLPGQLLFGRVFSAWNVLAYAAGIAVAAATDASGRPQTPATAHRPGIVGPHAPIMGLPAEDDARPRKRERT